MGSLAATICAKTLSPNVKVLVVAERDKIAGPGDMHEHAVEDNDRIEVTKAWGEKFIKDARYPEEIIVRNAYFEWVPAKWIDGYISESGILDKQSVMVTSLWARKREEELFSKFYTLRK
jgi:translation initiation factor 2B subunit (eIF-2B alpha/beta/delta family)